MAAWFALSNSTAGSHTTGGTAVSSFGLTAYTRAMGHITTCPFQCEINPHFSMQFFSRTDLI